MTAADQRNSRSATAISVDNPTKLKPLLANNNIRNLEARAKVDGSIDRLKEELSAHKGDGNGGDNGFVLNCIRTNADATHPLLPNAKVDRSAYDCVKVVEEGRSLEKTAGDLSSHPRLVSKDGVCLVRPIHQLNHYYRWVAGLRATGGYCDQLRSSRRLQELVPPSHRSQLAPHTYNILPGIRALVALFRHPLLPHRLHVG